MSNIKDLFKTVITSDICITDYTLNMVELGGSFVYNGKEFILCANELLFNDQINQYLVDNALLIVMEKSTGLLYLMGEFVDVTYIEK